jgi:hypothetical protein
MKQGSAKTVADYKTEPKPMRVNPGVVDQLGQALAFKPDPLMQGRGYSAPAPKTKQVHKSGSQGRH